MKDIINFFHKVSELKKVKRTGWIRNGVPNPESVAEHSFRTAMIALVLAGKKGLDTNKCVKMALVHDLAESIVGDITPHDKVSSEEKHKREKEAMLELMKYLDDNSIFDLWREYEESKTPEAIFVHELDRIEMLLQAFEYEKEHKEKDIDLNEFWHYVEKRVKDPQMIEIFELLSKKRSGSE